MDPLAASINAPKLWAHGELPEEIVTNVNAEAYELYRVWCENQPDWDGSSKKATLQARRIRNRAAAKESRKRANQYREGLENEIINLRAEVIYLRSLVERQSAEIAYLKTPPTLHAVQPYGSPRLYVDDPARGIFDLGTVVGMYDHPLSDTDSCGSSGSQ